MLQLLLQLQLLIPLQCRIWASEVVFVSVQLPAVAARGSLPGPGLWGLRLPIQYVRWQLGPGVAVAVAASPSATHSLAVQDLSSELEDAGA